jgi:hypothetical protein
MLPWRIRETGEFRVGRHAFVTLSHRFTLPGVGHRVTDPNAEQATLGACNKQESLLGQLFSQALLSSGLKAPNIALRDS